MQVIVILTAARSLAYSLPPHKIHLVLILKPSSLHDNALQMKIATLYPNQFLSTLEIFAILTIFAIVVQAESPNVADTQVILLKNNHVLHGQIALYGDRYLITQPHSEIRLPRNQVACICQDLGGAYRYLKHQIQFGEASDHLRLAQWCLDQSLLHHAQLQLEEGMLKDPSHPRIDLIGRRLKLANAIRVTSSREDMPGSAHTDAEELDTFFDQMPPTVVESFTRVIQPLLLNSCSARACHGLGGSTEFRLHRSARGHQPSRRVTLRNLHSVLRWIDPENIDNSPLLHFAVKSHFTMPQRGSKNVTWATGSMPERRLSAWVKHFSKHAVAPRELSSNDGSATAIARQDAAVARSDALFTWSDARGTDSVTAMLSDGGPKRGVKFRRQDPFDPTIFNHRHHLQTPSLHNGGGF